MQIEDLVEAGVHFGHRVSRWNPKMKPYIYGKRNFIHIIDLMQTVRGLARAQRFLRNLVSAGHKVVLVGTKRQIKNVVQTEATRCGMPYVTERWLGGTLTNYTTVRSRLNHLEELEYVETSGRLAQMPKKQQSFITRELNRIRRNLEGIRHLDRLPGALIVVDIRKEYIAVKEANRLGIPIVGILDSDCDPTQVDFAVPGNDDAMRSVQILLRRLADAMVEGRANQRGTPADPAVTSVDPDIRSKRYTAGTNLEKRQPPRPQRKEKPEAGDEGGEASAAATTATTATAGAEAPKAE
ncbi:MAG: 30S ribosomal protein S2 [Planctomycetes bacterium]|nr:30S ribosomal protein S2 [Planctomycetota bacterium]